MNVDILKYVVDGGVSALIAIVIVCGCYYIITFLFNKYFENAKSEIQKDIEKYKSDLENEKQAFVYNLNLKQQESKNDLDKLLHEHQVRFSSLYNERNRVINELFGLLCILYGKTKELVSVLKVIPPGTSFEYNDLGLINEIKELNEKVYFLYSPNRLYFQDKLSIEINSFRRLLESIVAEYNFNKNIKHINLQMISVLSDRVVNAESDLKAIEIEFRKILGVE